MSQVTIDQNQLKELILDSLAEILKNGDDNISDIYEDVLLGKIMEQDHLGTPKLVDADTLKKAVDDKLHAL